VVTIDLRTRGLAFLVTPGEPNQRLPLRARTTSQFLREFNLQVAINGDYFAPWHSKGPWNYYPHVGDPVGVDGFAASRGVVYSKGLRPGPTLYLSADNQASVGKAQGKIYNAISGNRTLLENGKPRVAYSPASDRTDLHPRTALALSRDRQMLILIIVDGRQSGYSDGATMVELRDIAAQYGGYSAIALDGGGSATLVAQDKAGKPVVLNSPIDNRFPGRERPVANHLGVYAAPVDGIASTR
jgi:exopolysaccharide biosynthesis protein